METLIKGTTETLVAKLDDRLDNVTDLTTYNVDYKVTSEDDDSVIQNWTPVNSKSGMKVFILVNTTGAGWVIGTYKLYVRPTIGSEQPILGPWEFGLTKLP